MYGTGSCFTEIWRTSSESKATPTWQGQEFIHLKFIENLGGNFIGFSPQLTNILLRFPHLERSTRNAPSHKCRNYRKYLCLAHKHHSSFFGDAIYFKGWWWEINWLTIGNWKKPHNKWGDASSGKCSQELRTHCHKTHANTQLYTYTQSSLKDPRRSKVSGEYGPFLSPSFSRAYYKYVLLMYTIGSSWTIVSFPLELKLPEFRSSDFFHWIFLSVKGEVWIQFNFHHKVLPFHFPTRRMSKIGGRNHLQLFLVHCSSDNFL